MANSFAMLTFVASVFSGSVGHTCDSIGGFGEDIDVADFVLIGNVTDYQIVTPEGSQPGSLKDYVLIGFDVTDTLKGYAKENWQLYLQNHRNYPLPDKFISDGPLIVIASFPDNPALSIHEYNPKELAPLQSDFLVVLHDPCDPLILNADSEILALVNNALTEPSIEAGRPIEEDTACFIARRLDGKLIKTQIPCPEE